MKTLIDKLRKVGKGFKRGLLVATAVASLGVASCKLCPDPEPINYAPEITSTPTTTQVDEGNSYNYDVDATDADGDKLTYSLPIAPNWLSINSNTGMISGTAPQVDSDTPCDIEVGVSDGVNPTATQNYTLTVKNIVVPPVDDYLDISGKLEDCESDTGKQGRIKIYDSLENYIGETQTDSNGNFSFHSDTKKATDLSNVVLRAINTDASSNQNSYVRTVTANVNSASEPDVTVNPIRVVPYNDLSTWLPVVTPEQFKTFMKQINVSINPIEAYGSETGLIKWDLSQLKGIEILLQNPIITGISFTSGLGSQQEIIANRIKSSNDIELYLEGRELDSFIQIDNSYPPSNPHYSVASTIEPNDGWIIVVPNNIVGGQTSFGYLNNSTSTGTINKVRIDLIPSVVTLNNPTVTHEFGHAFIASNWRDDTNGHCNILPFYNVSGTNTLTIMTPNNLKLPPPGLADEKAAKIVYENTYLPREKLDDILGTITF